MNQFRAQLDARVAQQAGAAARFADALAVAQRRRLLGRVGWLVLSVGAGCLLGGLLHHPVIGLTLGVAAGLLRWALSVKAERAHRRTRAVLVARQMFGVDVPDGASAEEANRLVRERMNQFWRRSSSAETGQ
jgi:hypothetical protein